MSDDLAGLPQLAVAGLREGDARLLLDAALTAPIDAQIRDRIVAKAHGNPLALLELPRALTAAEFAGGFGLPGALRLPGSAEKSFQRLMWGAGSGSSIRWCVRRPTGRPRPVRG